MQVSRKIAIIVLLCCCVAFAEGRKIKKQVQPVYPEIARRANIRGKVKIEVVVTKAGTVKSTKVIGGHPMLADAGERAVKQWVFEAGDEETTETIVLNFEPAE